MEGVEKDLRNLGVVNRKTKAQEQDGWRKVLEQAKTQRVVVPITKIIVIPGLYLKRQRKSEKTLGKITSGQDGTQTGHLPRTTL
jgi:hypothetical protein